jgi:hypothetical protein
MLGRGIRHNMHRVIHPVISPHRRHGNHVIAGLAVPAQLLTPHVCRLRAILTGPAVIDHQHPAAMRRGRRIRQQQLRPSRVVRLRSPPGTRTEELQPLNYRILCPGSAWPARSASCSGPAAPAASQVFPEPQQLRQRADRSSTGPRSPPAGSALQTRHLSRHHKPQGIVAPLSRAYRDHHPKLTN